MSTEIHEETVSAEANTPTTGPLGTVERHEEVHVIRDGNSEYRQQVTRNIGAERRISLSRGVQFIIRGRRSET